MFLLDTNTCIRYLNGRAPAIRTHLQAHDPNQVFICSIVKAEMYFGAAKSEDPLKTLENQNIFLAQFVSIAFDDLAATVYGRIRADLTKDGKLIGPNDLLIASIAIANDLVLVTHNTREFSRVSDLKLEDWEL